MTSDKATNPYKPVFIAAIVGIVICLMILSISAFTEKVDKSILTNESLARCNNCFVQQIDLLRGYGYDVKCDAFSFGYSDDDSHTRYLFYAEACAKYAKQSCSEVCWFL